jgi:hypothetical protein
MNKYLSLLLVIFVNITFIECNRKDGWKNSDTCLTASGAYYGLVCAISGPLAPVLCTASAVGMGVQGALCRNFDRRKRSIFNFKLNTSSDDE